MSLLYLSEALSLEELNVLSNDVSTLLCFILLLPFFRNGFLPQTSRRPVADNAQSDIIHRVTLLAQPAPVQLFEFKTKFTGLSQEPLQSGGGGDSQFRRSVMKSVHF